MPIKSHCPLFKHEAEGGNGNTETVRGLTSGQATHGQNAVIDGCRAYKCGWAFVVLGALGKCLQLAGCSLRAADSGCWMWESACLGEAFLTGDTGSLPHPNPPPPPRRCYRTWACPRVLKAETPAKGRTQLRRRRRSLPWWPLHLWWRPSRPPVLPSPRTPPPR